MKTVWMLTGFAFALIACGDATPTPGDCIAPDATTVDVDASAEASDAQADAASQCAATPASQTFACGAATCFTFVSYCELPAGVCHPLPASCAACAAEGYSCACLAAAGDVMAPRTCSGGVTDPTGEIPLTVRGAP